MTMAACAAVHDISIKQQHQMIIKTGANCLSSVNTNVDNVGNIGNGGQGGAFVMAQSPPVCKSG